MGFEGRKHTEKTKLQMKLSHLGKAGSKKFGWKCFVFRTNTLKEEDILKVLNP